MIIKSLKLQNYRRFRSADLELPENLIGIVGSNGSGKTTLVEAIGWVLYGNRIKRTDKSDIRSQFSAEKDVCSVEMIFAMAGEEYRILRQLKGKSAIAEAAIYRNGHPQPEAVQEKGVNDFVEQLINLDYKSFFVSVFARQKDLAALSLLQPEERRKSIARLINIDAIEKAKDQIRADKSMKKAQQEGMQAGTKDVKDLAERKKDVLRQVQEQASLEKRQKAEFSSLQMKLSEAKKAFDALNSVRDQFMNLKAKIDKWESRCSDFDQRKQRQIRQIDELKSAETELVKLRAMLADYRQIKARKEFLDPESMRWATRNGLLKEQKNYSDLIAKRRLQIEQDQEGLFALRDIREKVTAADAQLSDMEKNREGLRRGLTEAQAQKQKTKELGNQIKERKERVEDIGKESPCPVCTRPLGEHYETVIGHFADELADLRGQWKTYDQKESELNRTMDELNEKIRTLSVQRDQLIRDQEKALEREKSLAKTESELMEWEDRLRHIMAEIDALGKVEYDEAQHIRVKAEYEKLTKLHEQAIKFEENVLRLPQAREELVQLDQTVNDLQGELTSFRAELKKLDFDEQLFFQSKKEVDQLQSDRDQSRDGLDLLQRKILVLQKDAERIDEEIESQRLLAAQIREIGEELHYLTALEQHFNLFRQDLAGRIRPLIAQRTSDLLRLTTNGRYSILEFDEDYNIFLYDQSERYPLARFSGGEQDLANLCLRIAISQVVAERAGSTQVNFIVLDEIFGSQDEERKELILNTLQHLSAQFRQIFVITHVEEIKDILPVAIMVEDKNTGESAARLV